MFTNPPTFSMFKCFFFSSRKRSLRLLHKTQLEHLLILWSICRSSCPGVFCKKVFFKISQNSQKNTCARVSFLESTSGRLLLNLVNILLVRFSLSFHYVKRLQIWSFYWSVFSCIRTEYRPEKVPYLDNFLPVFLSLNILYYLQQLFCHS